MAMHAVERNGPVWSVFSWVVLMCVVHVSAAGGEERIIDAEPYDQLVLKATRSSLQARADRNGQACASS